MAHEFSKAYTWALPLFPTVQFKLCLQRNSLDHAKAMLLKMGRSSDFDPGEGPCCVRCACPPAALSGEQPPKSLIHWCSVLQTSSLWHPTKPLHVDTRTLLRSL